MLGFKYIYIYDIRVYRIVQIVCLSVNLVMFDMELFFVIENCIILTAITI